MNLALALSLFDLTNKPLDTEVLEELLDDSLFKFKQGLLAQKLHPKVLNARCNKALKLWRAANFLLNVSEEISEIKNDEVKISNNNLLNFYTHYELLISSIKLQIMNAENFESLYIAINQYYQIELAYYKELQLFIPVEPDLALLINKFEINKTDISVNKYYFSGELTNLLLKEKMVISDSVALFNWLQVNYSEVRFNLINELIRVQNVYLCL